MRRHLLLSSAVALAAIAGALGMRTYIGHPVERIIERHTVERIPEVIFKETPAAKTPGYHGRHPRPRPIGRRPGDDIANELNRRQL